MQAPNSLVHLCHESLRKQLCADNGGRTLYANTVMALNESDFLQDWQLIEIVADEWPTTHEIIFVCRHIPTRTLVNIAVPFKN